MAAFQTSDLVGTWRVKFRQWIWEYTLSADGNAKWRDPLNGMTGSGRWGQAPKVIFFSWAGSNTKESWNLPISQRMAGWIDASYGTGAAQVEKIGVSPKSAVPPPEGQLDATACWAASYAWWLRATPGQTPQSQLNILGLGAAANIVVDKDRGTVDVNRFMSFLTHRHGGLGASQFTPSEFRSFLAAGHLSRAPVIVGFSSSIMGGHVNVIHAFGPGRDTLNVMEPWFPDPSVDPHYEMHNVLGTFVFENKRTGAQFKFRGTFATRAISFYSSRPLPSGRIMVFPNNM